MTNDNDEPAAWLYTVTHQDIGDPQRKVSLVDPREAWPANQYRIEDVTPLYTRND